MSLALLYKLPEYREVFENIDWAGQLMDIEVLDQVEKPIEDKIIDIAKVVLSIESDVEGLNTELDRLKKRKQVMDNNIEQLRNWVLYSMMAAKDRVIESSVVSVSLRKSTPRVVVEDEALIPEGYFKVETVKKLNKDKVKEDLKNQMDVPGTTLAQDLCLVIK
jgi:hypothetical protein